MFYNEPIESYLSYILTIYICSYILSTKEKCNSIQMIVMQGKSYTRRANELKEEVRMMLEKVVDPVNQLELIDIYLAKTWFIIPF